MNTHVTFIVEEQGEGGAKARLQSITIVHHASAEERETVLRCRTDPLSGVDRHYPTHADARAVISERLCAKRTRLAALLDRTTHNLLNLDSLHPEPVDLDQATEEDYAELVAGFTQIREKAGQFTTDFLTVTKFYGAEPTSELFAITLPDDTACVQTFSPGMCATITRAMKEAGWQCYQDWNGVGLTHWSVVAKPA